MAKKYKGISRIDSGATHGWFVRIYRDGKTYPAFFADLKSGGKGKALKLALAHHEELSSKLPPRAKQPPVLRKNSVNTSGVIGVSRTRRTTPSGKIVYAWVASWRPKPNHSKNKFFSIETMGEKGAFDAAVKWRRKMERDILKARRTE